MKTDILYTASQKSGKHSLSLIILLTILSFLSSPGTVSAQDLRIGVYADAADVNRYLSTPEDRDKIASLLQTMHISRIFLEGRRGDDYAAPALLREARDDFRKKGFRVSGGVMFAAGKTWGVQTTEKGLPWMNYQADKTRQDIAQYFAENAPIFDDIIIDDMFATNDVSSQSESARGNRSWADYRQDLLVSVIEPYMLKPARVANPNIRVIIKYPQWYETFRDKGYAPARMSPLFNETWAGTETRDPRSVQPTEGYINYRWLSSVAGKKLNGGWFDYENSTPQNFVDQAYQTVLAGAPEFGLWHIGYVLKYSEANERLKEAIPELFDLAGKIHGLPLKGISFFMPPASNGEGNKYLADDLAMMGLPIVPEASYPIASRVAVLSVHAAADPEILPHMKQHLKKNATLILTPPFLHQSDKEAPEMSGVHLAEKLEPGIADKVEINGKQINLTTPLELDLSLEAPANEVIIWALAGARRIPLLTSRPVNGGHILVLNVTNYSRGGNKGLPGVPQLLADALRKEFLAPLGIQLSSPAKVSFYLWGNSRVFYNFRNEPVELILNKKTINLGANRVLWIK